VWCSIFNTLGSETSKYQKEKKSTEILLVAASENENKQIICYNINICIKEIYLEKYAIKGDSPVLNTKNILLVHMMK